MEDKMNWCGKWIGSTVPEDDGINGNMIRSSKGAPWLRREFTLEAVPQAAQLYIAAPGWYVLYINGQRVGDQVMAPVVTQPSARISYNQFEVSSLLRPGKNAVSVLLGNGWYNCQTAEVWEFAYAPWRNVPSLLLQLEDGAGKVILASDKSWRAAASHIKMNSLRNGETQDARMIIPGVTEPDFDDRTWAFAEVQNPPPGVLSLQELEPVRIKERVQPVGHKIINDHVQVFDFGRNLTGWCEVTLRGAAGATVSLRHSEQIQSCGLVNQGVINEFVKKGPFQCDTYILSGGKEESFSPNFTYHGFRYVQIKCDEGVDVVSIQACFIHNDFTECGSFSAPANATLDRLQYLNRYTYLCNYTGIPTDCPHREKNGWTGDANLAMETGIWNFDIRLAVRHFAQLLMDAQRPSGQLPGIAPTGGWGFNWGSGPGWDSYIFEAAEQSYRFYGDDTVIRRHYDGMKKYLEYCKWHETDNCVDFGLGDWCAPEFRIIPEVGLTSTGFYYQDVCRMVEFAQLLGKEEDAAAYREKAAAIRKSYNQRFANGDGTYGNGSLTALATPVYYGLAEDPEKTTRLLHEKVVAGGWLSQYGIFGAKFVPRVLAEGGYLEDVLKLYTQPNCPGWGSWIAQGATTLWEQWSGTDSQMHIMYGDPSACLYRYFGGIAPIEPAFKRFSLKPAVTLADLPAFECKYNSVAGTIVSCLKADADGKRTYTCTVPAGTTAELTLPGMSAPQVLEAGEYTYQL